MRLVLFSLLLLFPLYAFAFGVGNGGEDNGEDTDPGPGVPEIPAGAAPIIVAGLVGAVLYVRSRRNKKQ